jgi:hypothetical protein
MAINGKRKNQEGALRRRIEQFYELLNQQDFTRCHRMIDPRVRAQARSVTLLQYTNALRDFVAAVGPIAVERIDLDLHLDEPSALYEDRDFAVGETWWKGEDGQSRRFAERWVRDGRTWFTRNTGFVVPADASIANAASSSRPAHKAT